MLVVSPALKSQRLDTISALCLRVWRGDQYHPAERDGPDVAAVWRSVLDAASFPASARAHVEKDERPRAARAMMESACGPLSA